MRSLLDINVVIALLALAASRGGRLVTFDASIHREAAVGATESSLFVI